jgi:A/G-specific adenine glycosylase
MRISSGKTSTQEIRRALLRWYRAHRRELPWRKTRDPYAIWVSEIMLQQTRVVAVIEYYERFMQLFPTVAELAAAREESVLAAWSGLGYYRRARSLHAAARKIVDELDGRVPSTSATLRELPGIGRYTSAAIASIAYDEPIAVVDGNVERVLHRLDGVERNGDFVWTRAQELLAPRAAGDWNQAMMELGATICTPAAPTCEACPVQTWCKLPGHDVRRAQPARKKKELVCGLAIRKDRVYLVQRGKRESLMASMWDLPTVETSASVDVLARMKHSITSSDYTVVVVSLDGRALPKGGKWVPVADLGEVALTGIARKALRKVACCSWR